MTPITAWSPCAMVLTFVLWLCSVPASAQVVPDPSAIAAQGAAPVSASGGQRLSDAIVQARPPADAYSLGLMWLSASAQPRQQAQRDALLQQLRGGPLQHNVPAAHAERLQGALAAMPVTGRRLLAAHAPDWLQGTPAADPLLAEGDRWWLPRRPTTVRVWFDTGQACELPFAAQTPARALVAACAEPGSDEAAADEAQLIQPDGRIEPLGLAAWNATTQAAPAPGAWLWVRSRGSRWPQALHADMAQWLATQGPSTLWPLPHSGGAAPIDAPLPPPRSLPLSPSDWGLTGLLQTPTARSPRAGHFSMAISHTEPYTQYNVMLSPFDRVEIGLRYTNIGNVLYGPAIAGDQRYKDKSAEVKVRLLDEGRWTPALALGLRDTGGTGLFAGEYLVASKRWHNFDFSAGLGWGYFGARQSWRNPLRVFGRRFDTRAATDVGSGGTFEPSAVFTGRVAPFGGVQWHTPWNGLLVKLEHDGNDYQREPFAQRLPTRSPLNAAVVWQFGAGELSVGLARGGQQASVNLALYGSLPSLSTPKLSLPQPVEVRVEVQVAAPRGAPVQARDLLAELSAHTGWRAQALQRGEQVWVLRFDDAGGAYVQDRLDRAWAVLHREAPLSVHTLAIELAERQLPQVRHEVNRRAWAEAKSAQAWAPPGDMQAQAALAATQRSVAPQPATVPAADDLSLPTPRTRWSTSLGYQQHLGGPDGYLYAIVGRASAQLALWPGAWAQGTVQANLIDNYERYDYDGPSALPRVRTRLREYVTESSLTLPNLQLTQAARLSDNVYGMVYGGWLESMFAGVGGELLWRPVAWDRRVAFGVDINRVRQRDPAHRTRVLDYRVTTGHLSASWDTGWQDVIAQVAVGQYLAGDRGATLDLSRVFANGTRVGVWATKTNVSAARFGEGSFDKGVYLSIPFEALLTGWSPQTFSIAWQPLVRDGGARLRRGASLWALTDLRDRRSTTYQPAP